MVDFDVSIIYEDEYDSVFKDLSKINQHIEKNYKEYLGDKRHLLVELDRKVYIGNFSLTFSQRKEFLQCGNCLNLQGSVQGSVMKSIFWKSQNREGNWNGIYV